MRVLNLKQGWLVPHAYDVESAQGRTIYPEAMQMAQPGWARQAWQAGETVMRREGEVSEEEHAAAREWLWHLEAGRIGGGGD